MTTNAALIAEARAAHNVACPMIRRLADALEAAQAQVARLRAAITGAGTPEEMNSLSAMVARIGVREVPWPADLLAAVRIVNSDYATAEEAEAARATLRRYGLLPAAPMEDASPK